MSAYFSKGFISERKTTLSVAVAFPFVSAQILVVLSVSEIASLMHQTFLKILCSSLEPLLIKDIKVQVNKQKPSNVCPDQMKHNSDKMLIAPMSSQPCSKPNVVRSFLSLYTFFVLLNNSLLKDKVRLQMKLLQFPK
ncbi:MAG TPA: hypothetical protein VK489_06400 [Ferruginibacter sp.]|nr:hypothetical protein [Ferruginibacter sp.]